MSSYKKKQGQHSKLSKVVSSPDYKQPSKSYAEMYKPRPLKTAATIFKIHNPFSKRTTELNLNQRSSSPITRNYPKTYSATLSSNETEELGGDEMKNSFKSVLESRLKKFQREINPKGIEIPHNENSLQSDSSLDSILLQMKFDRRNSKSIEKLTDINISLAKELQAMKQQMEYIRLSQDLSSTLHTKRDLKVIL